MFMNKRGQFFIIISVVLAIAVFAITSKANLIQEAVLFEDFEDLSENYISESEYVINNALQNESNVSEKLSEFTDSYLKYSKQRNPNIKLLYVYSDGANVKLVNHFDSVVKTEKDVSIIGSEQDLSQEILIDVAGKTFSYKIPVRAENFGSSWYSGSLPNSFNLTVAGFLHNFDLGGSGPEFKVIINLPEGTAEHTYTGSSEYEWRASPPNDPSDEHYLNRQVSVRR